VLQQRRTAHKTGVKLGYKLFAAQICAGYQKVCSQEKFQQASGKVENQPDSRDPQHVTVIINSKSFHTHTHTKDFQTTWRMKISCKPKKQLSEFCPTCSLYLFQFATLSDKNITMCVGI